MATAVWLSSSRVPSTSPTSDGAADHMSATVAATCGAAMEVPLASAYPLGMLERTATPGAVRCGRTCPSGAGPRLENGAMRPSTSWAPTAYAPGASAGEPVVVQPAAPSLPLENTAKMPASFHACTMSS